MLYAAYFNLAQADNAARTAESRRSSALSVANPQAVPVEQSKPSKSAFKKFLNALRATEEDITPSGIYSPIIKNGPLFSTKENKTPSGIYSPIIKNGPLFSSASSKKRSSLSSDSSAGSNLKA